jgi:hypothetical protein
MCTLTIIRGWDSSPEQSWVRLAFNRDEQRSRPAALPPRIEQIGQRRAILPRDPVGGGTWIAVSDAGLGFALMNAYPGPELPPPAAKSRGLIIPALLACAALDDAVREALAVDARLFAPFRLIVLNERELVELASDAGQLRLRSRASLDAPQFFASSGLGDQVVEGPRREAFEEFLIRQPATCRQQDALHRHRWPDRPHLSVCMSRPEARSVSFTSLEIHPDRVAMDYRSIEESPSGVPVEGADTMLRLPRVATPGTCK